jgi:hypothetical protein
MYLENTFLFLNLNCAHFSCQCHAMISDAHMNPSRRDRLRASPNTDNSVLIQERTFQSTAAHRPVSWALPALKIATVGTGPTG